MSDQITRVEIFLNELQADIQVYQTTLNYLLANMLKAQPNPRAAFENVKSTVLWALDNPVASGSEDPQDAARMRELTKLRAEAFFQNIERAFETPGDTKAPRHH